MRAIFLAAAISVGLALSGCTYWKKVPLTGRDHPSGWADQIRRTAAETFIFAQLATNAYDKPATRYVLPETIKRIGFQRDDEIGFGYALYERKIGPDQRDLVLAFRGTDFAQPMDWACGNFVTCQNLRGLGLYRRIRTDHPGVPIHVVGHSLGGGIATYVSLHEPVAQSIAFNSSPRFNAPRNAVKNRRTSITEFGEILKAARLLGREADQLYMSIGCSHGGWIGDHYMRPLADCLTGIAAFESEEARQSLRLNPSIPRPPALHMTQ